ncbi:hypothetical protein FACS1894176_08590 [Bacteroidia bacterium]|nr:hypothetical protein FACS1894176_08590 [Bacteroidia bacterium]
MRVFHGSDTLVSVIDLQKCKPNRDFGRGFYVTKLRSQADDMAIRVTRYSKKPPYVTEYEFDEDKATDMFYSSATFGQLADTETKLDEKDWQKIYKMLKHELNL